MARLRLRLSADPSELAGLDSETELRQAQARLRDTRDDVRLTHVKRLAPDAIGVVVLVAPTVGADEIDAIATDLRSALGIGPGTNDLIHDEAGDAYVRGPLTPDEAIAQSEAIGPPEETCRECGIDGGRHVPGCPRDTR